MPLEDSLRWKTLWPIADHRRLLRLSASLRRDLQATWGDADADPLVRDGMFVFPLRIGQALVALQPERGMKQTAS